MRVESYHTPLVHHDDTIGVFHTQHALGYDNLGGAWNGFRKRFADAGIGGRITGTGGIVEYQDFWTLQ